MVSYNLIKPHCLTQIDAWQLFLHLMKTSTMNSEGIVYPLQQGKLDQEKLIHSIIF